MMSPARNAPSASDIPNADVTYAAPSPMKHDREREDLAVAELGDAPEGARHGESPADDERRDHDDAEHDTSRRGAEAGRRAGEQRREEHQRHDAEILEQQDRDDDAAVRRVELGAVGVDLEDDRGRREREQRAEEHRESHRRAEGERCPGDGGYRDADLQPSAAQDPLPHANDPGERQLEPDREQEEHDADFRERRDVVGLRDEPQRVRPDGDAGEQESNDGRDAQTLRDDDDRNGDRDEDDEVAKDGDLMHAA